MRLLFVCALLLLDACASMPETRVRLRTKDGLDFALASPKQVEATNIVAGRDTNGLITVKIGSLKSINDPALVSALFAAQIEQMKQSIAIMEKVMEMMKAAGVSAVAP